MDILKHREARAEFLFRKADHFELSLCQRLNRMGHLRAIRLFFKGISRLGDGVFWYSLALALPLMAGAEGLEKLGHITVTGLICILIYSQLKNRLVRKRPFISFPDIHAHTAPLDKYSFPSGHTMNAVNFAVLFTWAFPPLAYLVVPFALLVALSRVILGMHYPTDVMVGAALGLILSWGSLLLFPAGIFAGAAQHLMSF
ncbi:MAG: phosphatase PAP2 family protein [Thalassolituus sp.]|jgi:undecaprenyl-diphosphatase|uniref:phosphatase PAP2 family protein n=1 Tax=Thalassolituus sp. TaxID=2030822 RepID=UPI002439891F|nr:phosphatase PAP2 family protein [Pseudomonadota bacterium]TNC86213.1 MAG: phosphatase PAP2 family protein [Thalassolituus sp.]MEC8103412.1 phosphatase PAP2 family protein [Pseudomonadota bacterium]MEC8443980.1 phosphatase PAP2 family protein [Pseudomonadota bacterium]MEC8523021.1 phosphatase PAP2 family protein [Pseudomonadota bacterium]